MPRRLFPLLLLICGFLALTIPNGALADDIRRIDATSQEVRLRIAELDQLLREHLRKALVENGDKTIECGATRERKSFARCIAVDNADLRHAVITIAPHDSDDEALNALAAAEERFALLTERIDRTNDLLSRAGAKLYRSSFNLTPEMDNLRRQVIVYVERRHDYGMRVEQAMLIAAVTGILLVIFSAIFIILRRLRGR